MKEIKIYPNIDMQRTGIRLKELIQKRGYCVTDIQEYLHLSCPQPVYRWFKGTILPSVDHLLMLSELLGVHMEELLVKKQNLLGPSVSIAWIEQIEMDWNDEEYVWQEEQNRKQKAEIRLRSYYKKLADLVA